MFGALPGGLRVVVPGKLGDALPREKRQTFFRVQR